MSVAVQAMMSMQKPTLVAVAVKLQDFRRKPGGYLDRKEANRLQLEISCH